MEEVVVGYVYLFEGFVFFIYSSSLNGVLLDFEYVDICRVRMGLVRDL